MHLALPWFMKGDQHESSHGNRRSVDDGIGSCVEGVRALPVLFLKNIGESPAVVLKKATVGFPAVGHLIGTTLNPILLGGWTNPR